MSGSPLPNTTTAWITRPCWPILTPAYRSVLPVWAKLNDVQTGFAVKIPKGFREYLTLPQGKTLHVETGASAEPKMA